VSFATIREPTILHDKERYVLTTALSIPDPYPRAALKEGQKQKRNKVPTKAIKLVR